MATAAVRISRRNSEPGEVTTVDALLTEVAVDAVFASVTVQLTSTAGGRVQRRGGSQGGAVATGAAYLSAGGSAIVKAEDCGAGGGQAWSFWIARSTSTNATFTLGGTLR